jgi:hypothetical protein
MDFVGNVRSKSVAAEGDFGAFDSDRDPDTPIYT